MIFNLILIFLGFVLLIKGADFLVDGASNIAQKFHIPEIIIGLTIVSIGTSMPELAVSVNAAIQGHSDLAIGNVVGSNLANLFLILGACAIIKPLEFKRETRLFESPFTIMCTVMLFLMCNTGNSYSVQMVTRYEGFMLILVCIAFICYNIYMAKRGEEFDREDFIGNDINHNMKILPTWNSIVNIIIGMIGLKFGGDFVVDNSVEVAKILGISETVISLTIVAFSTCLPELITSITATSRGETDMAIGNVLGSQIFNILLIIGVSAIVSPIQYALSYNSSIFLLIIGSIMLVIFPFIPKKNYMGRLEGLLFTAVYITYLINLVSATSIFH